MEANIKKLIERILADAQSKRESAGYAGEMGDGGASRLEEQVKFFTYGYSETIPLEWKKYEEQIDPEYQEYIRLKNKFEKR